MSDTELVAVPTSFELPETNPAETVAAVIAPAEGEKKEAAKPEQPKIEEPKKEDSKMAAKFAALSKRDREIKAREKALEAREKAIKEAAVKPPEKVEEKAPLKSRMKKDPFNTLKEEFGLDLETLTKIALNEGKLPGDMAFKIEQEETAGSLRAELDALKKELAEEKKSKADKDTQEAQNKAFRDFKNEIGAHVKASPAEYELLSLEEDPSQVIYEVIEAHYEATKGQVDPEKPDVGRILSIKEAADHVESHLLEEAKKYTSLSKIKGLFGSQTAPKEVTVAPKESPKTLSNEQNGEAAPTKKKVQTREEELADAMKLIKFNSN